APRWDGKAHRLEVWYSTFTDPTTGDGYWLHYETVAPVEGQPYAHGWAAVFPPGGPARAERFGPVSIDPPGAGSPDSFRAGPAAVRCRFRSARSPSCDSTARTGPGNSWRSAAVSGRASGCPISRSRPGPVAAGFGPRCTSRRNVRSPSATPTPTAPRPRARTASEQ